MPPKPSIEIFDVFETTNSGQCVVIEYKNALEVKVLFVNTNNERVFPVDRLKEGLVRDPEALTVAGVAKVGISKLSKHQKRIHSIWSKMIERCYVEGCSGYDCYGAKGIRVCDEWLDFRNYLRWYDDNYQEGYDVDKDLTSPYSKIYSPETCSFIPKEINRVWSVHRKRWKYPIGVNKTRNKTEGYIARATTLEGREYLGIFRTPEEAFTAYKKRKEEHLRHVAEEYFKEGKISKAVRDTLYNLNIKPYTDEDLL